jgi:hypothetical protein
LDKMKDNIIKQKKKEGVLWWIKIQKCLEMKT